MPYSDRPSHDDALTRQVVHQLADDAPPPPPWEAVADRVARSTAGGRGDSWRPLAMVAAVVLLVALGFFVFERQRGGERAELPVATLPPPTSSTVAGWLDLAEPHEVQVCLARSTLRLGRSIEAGPLDDELDLTGVTPERAELAKSLSPVVVMRAALENGDLDTAMAASVAPVVEAWADADGVVTDPTSTDADRRAVLGRFRAARDTYLAAPPTFPCVFDSADAIEAVEASSLALGPLTTARCMSALGLDRALGDMASRADRSRDPLLDAALSGFTVWDNRPQPSIADLGSAVVAVRNAEPGERVALIDRARTDLRRLDDLVGCPTWTDPAVLELD